MIEEVTQEKLEEVAMKVITMCRNKLVINLRYLDMALSHFEFKAMPEFTDCTSTDGWVYLYNPKHILTAYRMEENLPTRNFLHSVFHCVYKHMYINPSINRDLWDIACDVAVESTINDLQLSYLNVLKAQQQEQFLEGFKSELKLISAERVYRWLLDKKLNEKRIKQLKILFKADDHPIWYMDDDAKRAAGIPTPGSPEEGEEDWQKISERMQVDMSMFRNGQGSQPGLLSQNLRELNREKYNYDIFLRKFATRGETMRINPDEFDYNFYTYGLSLYENMPLIEPLEYKDTYAIRDFVIAIDTSGSTSGELVQTFIQKTYNILKSTESFFTKINLHIIQCDAAIQEDVKITSQEDFDDYLRKMEIHGLRGTDFRPVFSYVDSLIECKEFDDLKGLIYFTDGYGSFPSKMPSYETAFVFIDDECNNYDVPSWAIKLILDKHEL